MTLPHRIFNDWLHWRIGRWTVGWHRYGLCWTFRYERMDFATGDPYLRRVCRRFWRLFWTTHARSERKP